MSSAVVASTDAVSSPLLPAVVPTARPVLLAGCGDLGWRVAQRLLARGQTVIAVRRTPPAGPTPAGLTWLAADLTQPDALAALPPVSQVVYLPTPGRRAPEAYTAIFETALAHTLHALHRAPPQRFVFVSSSAVYGEHGGEWVDEDTPTAPLSFNGTTLVRAEALAASAPWETTALRLSGLYGPGRLALLERLRAGRTTVPVDPPHWANRIHIDDAAAAVVHLLDLPAVQPCYLGTDDTPERLDSLYGWLAAQVGAPAPAVGPAPANVGSKRLSNARLRASGFHFEWPETRAGYRALLTQAEHLGSPRPA